LTLLFCDTDTYPDPGFIKGFIMQLAAGCLVVGIYVAIHFSAYLEKSLFSSVNGIRR